VKKADILRAMLDAERLKETVEDLSDDADTDDRLKVGRIAQAVSGVFDDLKKLLDKEVENNG